MNRLIDTIKDTWPSPAEVTVTSCRIEEGQILLRELVMRAAGVNFQFLSSAIKLCYWRVKNEVPAPESPKISVGSWWVCWPHGIARALGVKMVWSMDLHYSHQCIVVFLYTSSKTRWKTKEDKGFLSWLLRSDYEKICDKLEFLEKKLLKSQMLTRELLGGFKARATVHKRHKQ